MSQVYCILDLQLAVPSTASSMTGKLEEPRADEWGLAQPQSPLEAHSKHSVAVDLLTLALYGNVVLLDDMHWCDDESWRVLHALVAASAATFALPQPSPTQPEQGHGSCKHRSTPRSKQISAAQSKQALLKSRVAVGSPARGLRCLAMTSRPFAAHGYAQRFLSSASCLTVPLPPLCRTDVQQLACQVLNVVSIPKELTQLLIDRGQGNPLFVTLLVTHLRQQGHIKAELVRSPSVASKRGYRAKRPTAASNDLMALESASQLHEAGGAQFADPPNTLWRETSLCTGLPRFSEAAESNHNIHTLRQTDSQLVFPRSSRRSILPPLQRHGSLTSHRQSAAAVGQECCRVASLTVLGELPLPDVVQDLLLHNFDRLSRGE